MHVLCVSWPDKDRKTRWPRGVWHQGGKAWRTVVTEWAQSSGSSRGGNPHVPPGAAPSVAELRGWRGRGETLSTRVGRTGSQSRQARLPVRNCFASACPMSSGAHAPCRRWGRPWPAMEMWLCCLLIAFCQAWCWFSAESPVDPRAL